MFTHYLICDHLRLVDLLRMDTSAGTPPEAQAAAEAMAAQYGCRVYVLGVVGVVECPAKEPQWVKAIPAQGGANEHC